MGISRLEQRGGFVVLPGNSRASKLGYTTHVDKNGLISVLPVRRKRSFTSLKFFAAIVVIAMAFKAFALMNIGYFDYHDAVALMQSGSVFEQAAAWVLQVDPVTQMIYELVYPLTV